METILNSWVRVGFNAWMLAVEASLVVPLRTMRMLGGGSAGRSEAYRAMNEIRQESAALPARAETVLRGAKNPAVADRTIKKQRDKVRATSRRLSKA